MLLVATLAALTSLVVGSAPARGQTDAGADAAMPDAATPDAPTSLDGVGSQDVAAALDAAAGATDDAAVADAAADPNHLVAADFTLGVSLDGGKTFVDRTKWASVFNRAHCECNSEVLLRVTIAASGRGKLPSTGGTLSAYLHPACVSSDEATRTAAFDRQLCTPVASTNDLGQTAHGATPYVQVDKFKMQALFASPAVLTDGGVPADAGAGSSEAICNQQESRRLYLAIDRREPAGPDQTGADAPALDFPVDGKPPAAPTALTVEPTRELLKPSWKVVTDPTIARYVVFCAKSTGEVAYPQSRLVQGYELASDVCPGQIAAPAAARGSQAIEQHQRDYACGEVTHPKASLDLEGLSNAGSYVVAVAAVDKSGNIGPVTPATTSALIVTRDFFNDYTTKGGAATGGYCAIGGGQVRAGLMALGLVSALIAMLRAARRRRAFRARARKKEST